MLSSAGHSFSDVSLDDPGFEHTPYDAWIAYGRAKTANVLFAVELDRRLRDRGVRATAVHPGGILTELGRHLTDETMGALIERSRRHGRSSSSRCRRAPPRRCGPGSSPTPTRWVAATARTAPSRRSSTTRRSSPGVMRYALDPGTAAALWTLSEELVGETFDP